MNCTHVEKLLPLYVEGDLDTARDAALRAHLVWCQACQQLAAEYEESQQWLHSYAPPDFPAEFDEALFDELSAAVRREGTRENTRPGFLQLIAPFWGWHPVLAASLALLTIVCGLALYLRFKQALMNPEMGVPVAVRLIPLIDPAPIVVTPGLDQDGNKERIESTLRHIKSERDSSPLVEASAPVNTVDATLPLAIAKVLPPEATEAYQNEVAASKNPRAALESLLDRFSTPQAVVQLENSGAGSQAPTDTASAPEVTRIEMQTANPKVRIIWLAPKETTNSQSNKTSRDTN